ncbi:SRPBCC domain-containing protein [Mycobacterium sp. NPDC006124]|uniref:SRPBCC family protein n=1 Tax=Mycobacterium sp. NPDC006124 TaxID=3156729 RepID=UPI0033AC6672
MVHQIEHELRISSSPDRVFEALTTLEGVKGWHTPTATGTGEVGSEWVFTFADHPEFAWVVLTSEPNREVGWRCTRGPGDSVGTTATFVLSETDDDRVLLEHVHAGWPGTHGNFRKCNTTWGVLLHHLRTFVETGTAATAFE